MVNPPHRASAANVPLIRDGAAGDLVEDALRRILAAIEIQVVEEGRDGVVGDVGGRELLGGELRGAVGEAEVAVGGGEGVGVGLRVDAHGKGEVDSAVAVVFVVADWVAEVAGGGGGENEVGGAGGRGCGCGGGCAGGRGRGGRDGRARG